MSQSVVHEVFGQQCRLNIGTRIHPLPSRKAGHDAFFFSFFFILSLE